MPSTFPLSLPAPPSLPECYYQVGRSGCWAGAVPRGRRLPAPRPGGGPTPPLRYSIFLSLYRKSMRGAGGGCPESPGAAAPAHAQGAPAAAGPGRGGISAARRGWSRSCCSQPPVPPGSPSATARRRPGARRHDGQVRPGRGGAQPGRRAGEGAGPAPQRRWGVPPLWRAVEGRE